MIISRYLPLLCRDSSNGMFHSGFSIGIKNRGRKQACDHVEGVDTLDATFVASILHPKEKVLKEYILTATIDT